MPQISLTFESEEELGKWLDSKIVERMGTKLVDYRVRLKRKSVRWTPEEDQFLVNQSKTSHTAEWMAKYLGRPTAAVNMRIQKLRAMLTPGVVPFRRKRHGKVLLIKP